MLGKKSLRYPYLRVLKGGNAHTAMQQIRHSLNMLQPEARPLLNHLHWQQHQHMECEVPYKPDFFLTLHPFLLR